MTDTHKKIETVANVAIVIVALLLGVTFIKPYLFPASVPKSLPNVKSENIKTGTKISLPDIDWSKNDKNLVLALSTTCRYCTESVPFYQKITQQKVGHNNARMIAALPQTVDEARRYLSEHNFFADEVRQVSLDDISVQGTPTLILVDRTGAVIESWVGKLPAEKEAEVIARFLGER